MSIPAGYFNVTNDGYFKVSSSTGKYNVVGPGGGNTPSSSLTARTVADILAGTFDNPHATGTTWSNQDAIVFETPSYRYEIDGSDASAFDKTISTANALDVLFTPNTGQTFFGSVGDKLKFKITDWNWGSGRLRIGFTNATPYGLSNLDNVTFAYFLINGKSTSGNGPNGNMNWLKSNGTGTTEVDTLNLSSATSTAFTNVSTSAFIIIELERMSANEIRATLTDSSGAAFASQGTLTCNTSSSIDTNSTGMVVADITHMRVQEVSGSEIDLTVEKA